MKKISIIFVWGVIIVVALIAVVSFLKFNYTDRVDAGLPVAKTSSPLDSTYTIGDQPYALLGGRVEKEVAPESAMKEKVSVFGEPVYGDLDADGDLDAALFMVQESGGSGVFYYIAVAVNDAGVYKGTNAMLLGDRIAPQTIEVRNGRVVANYAERKANEAFTVAPSVGKSIWIHLDIKKYEIGELVQNFEGEADPARMTLGGQKWKWIRTTYGDGKIVTPEKKEAFTVLFKEGGAFSVTTDCNSAGGKYVVNKNSLTFKEMFATKMFCENSQETVFTAQLGEVATYHFTSKGELMLNLEYDRGTITLQQ